MCDDPQPTDPRPAQEISGETSEGAAHEVSGDPESASGEAAYFVCGSSGALAYFLTFTTYGTWLHGTDKGAGSVDRDHREYDSPFVAPDPRRQGKAMARMKEPPYVLTESARRVVRDAIVDLCEEKGWTLRALHVRSNHVHAVVSADREPGRLMSDLKARASRDLNRQSEDTQAKRWTRHGSTRHLFDAAAVQAAERYTLDEQGKPMAIHDPRPKEPRKDRKEPRTK